MQPAVRNLLWIAAYYAVGTALLIGLGLLAGCGPDMPPPTRAESCGVIAETVCATASECGTDLTDRSCEPRVVEGCESRPEFTDEQWHACEAWLAAPECPESPLAIAAQTPCW